LSYLKVVLNFGIQWQEFILQGSQHYPRSEKVVSGLEANKMISLPLAALPAAYEIPHGQSMRRLKEPGGGGEVSKVQGEHQRHTGFFLACLWSREALSLLPLSVPNRKKTKKRPSLKNASPCRY